MAGLARVRGRERNRGRDRDEVKGTARVRSRVGACAGIGSLIFFFVFTGL
jgi:hypothetical protein